MQLIQVCFSPAYPKGTYTYRHQTKRKKRSVNNIIKKRKDLTHCEPKTKKHTHTQQNKNKKKRIVKENIELKLKIFFF